MCIRDRDVSLTISYQDGNTPLVGAEFDIFLVATVDEYGELTTTKDFAQFHVNIRGKDDEAWRTLASTLEGYVLRDDISPTDSGKTNDKGLVSFPTAGKSLKAGLYFVLGYRHTQNGFRYDPTPVSYTHLKRTITDTDSDKKFTYYVGSLAPGESKTLTYTVNVEPGVFMAAGNKAAQINNRACIYTDDRRTDGGVWLNGHNASKTIDRKVWSRKLAGGKQETASTVSMGGSVYDATGSSVTPIPSPDSSFTVPAGSYKYQVAANEAGDWDLSSASMADSLGSKYMQFVGYVRVDAYTISGNAPGSGLDDAAAIANLSSREPNQTVWVKVDGKTSFSFTPAQIGLKGKQAYLLTYYAQPKNIDGITQVVVSLSLIHI